MSIFKQQKYKCWISMMTGNQLGKNMPWSSLWRRGQWSHRPLDIPVLKSLALSSLLLRPHWNTGQRTTQRKNRKLKLTGRTRGYNQRGRPSNLNLKRWSRIKRNTGKSCFREMYEGQLDVNERKQNDVHVGSRDEDKTKDRWKLVPKREGMWHGLAWW